MRFDQETSCFIPEGGEIRLLGGDHPIDLNRAMDFILHLRQMRTAIEKNDADIKAMDDPGDWQAVIDQHVLDKTLIVGMDQVVMTHLPTAVVTELEP